MAAAGETTAATHASGRTRANASRGGFVSVTAGDAPRVAEVKRSNKGKVRAPGGKYAERHAAEWVVAGILIVLLLLSPRSHTLLVVNSPVAASEIDKSEADSW